ncbi:MAG: hypothetical protein V7K48_11835 [Nostoc sp.]|uniref:hypothetical protein n=1 Tax=Nostoc sp. TaxID=1180 RepID=UPI002FF58519
MTRAYSNTKNQLAMAEAPAKGIAKKPRNYSHHPYLADGVNNKLTIGGHPDSEA